MLHNFYSVRGALLALGVLAACVREPDTLICWEEPVRPSPVGFVVEDKWNPSEVTTICAPLSSRLVAQRRQEGIINDDSDQGLVATASGSSAAASEGTAVTYRDATNSSLGTIAIDETNDRLAGTDRRESSPSTYVGSVETIQTGQDIRNAVANLGDDIRGAVADALP